MGVQMLVVVAVAILGTIVLLSSQPVQCGGRIAFVPLSAAAHVTNNNRRVVVSTASVSTQRRRHGRMPKQTLSPAAAAAAVVAPLAVVGSSTTRATTSSHGSSSSMPVSDTFPRTWVPLASALELDPHRPNLVYFLGRSYIVYCCTTNSTTSSNTNEWVVTDAVCPHRRAPLAEGRINEQGHLECSYHGWSFHGKDGTLQRIPQLTGMNTELSRSTALQPLQQQLLCRLGTYATVVEKNLIWAWLWPTTTTPVASDDSDSDEATATTDVVVTATDNNFCAPWSTPEHQVRAVLSAEPTTYTRDLPYPYERLLENFVDPSHVPFAHHGLQGHRTDAVPLELNMVTTTLPHNNNSNSNVVSQGFAFEFTDRTMGMDRKGRCDFQAPFVVHYNSTMNASRPFQLTAVMIPTRPGWSRIMLFGSSRTPDTKRPFSLAAAVYRSLPLWIVHQLNNRFLDSDLALLHYQQDEDEEKTYITPAPADRSVRALRAWIKAHYHVGLQKKTNDNDNDDSIDSHQPRPASMPAAAVRSSRPALFDRYEQHTDQCVHCRTAMIRSQLWRTRTVAVTAVSALLCHRWMLARLSLAGGIVLLGLVFPAVQASLRQGDFRHYENH